MAETTPEKQPWAHRVAAAIDELTRTDRITWGADGEWRRYRAVVLEQLSLAHLDDGSLPPAVLEKGSKAWLDDEDDVQKSMFMVTHGGYGSKVPAQSVEVESPAGRSLTTRPPLSS